MAPRILESPAVKLAPRAPTVEEWEALSPEERQRVVDALPSYAMEGEFAPPEGDRHWNAKVELRQTLQGHFRSTKRRAYVGSDLMVYYPGAPRFAPDLLVVFDVEPHGREKWVASAEGKGLDFIMEVAVSGDRRKDLQDNVELYAQLAIPEYFVFDRGRGELHGWTISPGERSYRRIVPQNGRLHSRMLDLDLVLEDDRVRFYFGSAVLLDQLELAERVERTLQEAVQRAERRAAEESARAAEEAARAETERRARTAAEEELAKLREELERLKKKL